MDEIEAVTKVAQGIVMKAYFKNGGSRLYKTFLSGSGNDAALYESYDGGETWSLSKNDSMNELFQYKWEEVNT